MLPALIAAAPAIGRGALMAAGFAPLIMDLFKSGAPDKSAIDQVVAQRDSKVQQLVGAGMKQADAEAQVNAEIEPILNQMHKSDGPSGGELLADAATGVAGVIAGRKLFPKSKPKIGDANLDHTKLPENSGVSQPGKPAQEMSNLGEHGDSQGARNIDSGNFKSAAREAAERGSMDSVSGDTPGKFGGYLAGPSAQPAQRGFNLTSPDGGSMPIDREELMRMAIAAKIRQSPSFGQRRDPTRLLEADPAMGRTFDLERIAGNMYGRAGD